MINNAYKIYLAFENSICEDYVTEKLYRTMQLGGIIPVVLGQTCPTVLSDQRNGLPITSCSGGVSTWIRPQRHTV